MNDTQKYFDIDEFEERECEIIERNGMAVTIRDVETDEEKVIFDFQLVD